MVLKISADQLRVGMYIQKLGGSWLSHPFFRSRFLLDKREDLQAIIDAGIHEVWIDPEKGLKPARRVAEDEKPSILFQRHLSRPGFSPPPDSPPPDSPPPEKTVETAAAAHDQRVSVRDEMERAQKICTLAKSQIATIFTDARLGKTTDTKSMLPLVDEIASSVQRQPVALMSIARLKTHDDYTYLHSLAVCTMMIALGRELGMEEAKVKAAGLAGLLHDIGKASIPLEILNKPDRLTNIEFEVIKRHASSGGEMLEAEGESLDAQDVALHHHEKVDGSGYPEGLAGEGISLFARMAAVCDVYDAVTSNRAYKKAWDPAHTLRQMASWPGHFDKRIFNAFVKTIGIYPVGSLVRLASQRLAVVVEPNPEALLKPVVRAFFSVVSQNYIVPYNVNLAAPGCDDSIVSLEEAERWGLKRIDDIWLPPA